MQTGSQIDELTLGGRELALRVERFDLHVRVGELEQHRVRLHRNTGLDEDALDARGGERGDPADVLGDERSRTADLAHHCAATHAVERHDLAIDARRRGFRLASRIVTRMRPPAPTPACT